MFCLVNYIKYYVELSYKNYNFKLTSDFKKVKLITT